MAGSLIRKSLTYLIGTAGTRLVGVVLIPLYAFFVKPAELGEFDFIQTLGGLTAAVVFVAAWEAIIRFAMAKRTEWNLSEVTRSVMLIGGIGALVAAAAAVVLSLIWPESTTLFVGAAAVAILTGFLNVWQNAARAAGKPRLFVTAGVLNAVVNLVGVGISVIVLKWGAVGLLMSYAVGMLVAVIVLESQLRLLRTSGWGWPSAALTKSVLRFAFPMMLDFLASFLSLTFGRILITAVLGTAANGEYAFTLKIAMTISAVATVLSMAALEETVVRAHLQGVAQYLSTLLTGGWHLMMSGGALLVLAARLLYEFLGNTGYAHSFPLIPPLTLMAALAALGALYGNSFQIGHKTSYFFYTTVVATVIIVIGSLSTIHSFGVMGVAIVTLVANVALVSLRRWLARKIIPFDEKPAVLLSLALFLAAWAITTVPLPPAALITGGILCAIAAAWAAWRGFTTLRRIETAPNPNSK